ncbi:MAG: hypothetical protein JRJ85_20730 [Deltaproteobacteria bacterium]|nr:hypothetical protein [Deltaproteobacteria bacterium]
MIDLWRSFYAWGSAQPVFIQVALGIGIVLVCLYVFAWILGIGFLTLLRLSDRKKDEKVFP